MNIALIGFGAVGQGLTDILAEDPTLPVRIVGVAGRRKGSLYRAEGLAPRALLAAAAAGDFGTYPAAPGLQRGLAVADLITQGAVDAVVEITPTDIDTAQPALDYCRAALEAGKHLVTANKGPAALAWDELHTLATARGLGLGIEGTVMSGTPALRLGAEALRGMGVTAVRGILNGTSNYILTQMEAGLAYADALAEAQRLGYAETDPTADVEGHDAAAKVVILANVVLGAALRPADVALKGITSLTPDDIAAAAAEGYRWKLIGSVEVGERGLVARVAPERLPLDDPLASVSGANNAVTFQTRWLGPVTLVGAGAGRRETGAALLADLLHIAERYA
ncbi:MAG: homoserine dehydrogenase [Anaerolineales bacterium]